MNNNQSKLYDRNGFVALISIERGIVINITQVVANQVYNAVGISILFAETREELKNKCLSAGYTIAPELL